MYLYVGRCLIVHVCVEWFRVLEIQDWEPQTRNLKYRISANSFRGNYSFLKVEVRKLFKGGNYSKEETINLLLFL